MNIFKSQNTTELFNFAYAGVVAQGMPAVLNYRCAYKTQDGQGNTIKCGIGHCLTDDAMEFASSFNGGLRFLIAGLEEQTVWEDTPSDELTQFLIKLQSAHDDATEATVDGNNDQFIDLFRNNMLELAHSTFGDDITIDPEIGIVG